MQSSTLAAMPRIIPFIHQSTLLLCAGGPLGSGARSRVESLALINVGCGDMSLALQRGQMSALNTLIVEEPDMARSVELPLMWDAQDLEVRRKPEIVGKNLFFFQSKEIETEPAAARKAVRRKAQPTLCLREWKYETKRLRLGGRAACCMNWAGLKGLAALEVESKAHLEAPLAGILLKVSVPAMLCFLLIVKDLTL